MVISVHWTNCRETTQPDSPTQRTHGTAADKFHCARTSVCWNGGAAGPLAFPLRLRFTQCASLMKARMCVRMCMCMCERVWAMYMFSFHSVGLIEHICVFLLLLACSYTDTRRWDCTAAVVIKYSHSLIILYIKTIRHTADAVTNQYRLRMLFNAHFSRRAEILDRRISLALICGNTQTEVVIFINFNWFEPLGE